MLHWYVREADSVGAVSVMLSCVEEMADNENIEGAVY